MDFLGHLAGDARAVVATVRTCQLDAALPSCPGWNVGDVVRHLGAIHRWATAVVTTGEAVTRADGSATLDDGELAQWFEEGAAALLTALSEADPDRDCWTFGFPPARAGFWRRRQALETVMHRWDIDSALGRPATIPADLAEEGIDEVVNFLYPRQVALGRTSLLDRPFPVPPPDQAEEFFLALWGRGKRERFGLPGDARLTP